MSDQIERRTMVMRELRAVDAGDNAPAKLVGYASVFGVWSEDLGGFRERVEPGAFTNALKTSDTRALINHDPNLILGRTKSSTLALREDDTGLWADVTVPDTQYARDLLESVRRGDIDQMSFAFSVLKDDWSTTSPPRRSIIEVGTLYDVAFVTYPAYPQTSASARARATSISESQHNASEASQAAALRAERGAELQAQFDIMRRRLSLLEIE